MKLYFVAPALSLWFVALVAAFMISGCAPVGKSTSMEQSNDCPPSYSPLPFESTAPVANLSAVMAKGTLVLAQAEFFTVVRTSREAPLAFHFIDDRGSNEIKTVCISKSNSGANVNDADYYVPAFALQNARGDITSEARRYSFTLNGTHLSLEIANDARLGQTLSPEQIIEYNQMWKAYRFYKISETRYELHLEQNLRMSGDFSRTTRMIARYDLVP